MGVNDIPFEVLEIVFMNLDVISLLRCRQVNKFWHSIINGMKLKNLAIGTSFKERGNFFSTNYPIKKCNLLLVSRVKFLKSKFMKNSLLSRLKQLYIQSSPNHGYKFSLASIFSQFKEIETFHIDDLKYRGSDDIVSENLKNLTVLHLRIHCLRLYTPNLAKFKTHSNLFSFRFEENSAAKVTHLSLTAYEDSKMSMFPSLEYLYINAFLNLPANDILTRIPKLKHIYTNIVSSTDLSNLIKQIKVNRNLDFRFYLSCVNIESQDDIDNYMINTRLKGNLIHFFEYHSNKLSKLVPKIKTLNYLDLLGVFRRNNSIDDFFTKFNDIRQVRLKLADNQIIDLDLFRKFISKCTFIDGLSLIGVQFDQQFFNSLNLFCRYLTDLEIEMKNTTIKDINFLYNHILLVNLSINQQLDYKTIQKLFQFKSFSQLKFTVTNKPVVIHASELKNRSCISLNGKNAFFGFKTKMIEFLEQLISFGFLNSGIKETPKVKEPEMEVQVDADMEKSSDLEDEEGYDDSDEEEYDEFHSISDSFESYDSYET